ncbi:hypothetical protein CLV84_2746 [Neolewinella xylanilytica]|uniref:Mannosyltransferase PIG-V n=1 Tax=Neolewinella xylanilytica TaxID=1514080 RepID=A0A2S6I450_9BACT|nr:hypothetical protein [Neolewinella xylanilytica]PPK85839.1 hypothetical protein CLV84_2746 [Neolewinella xylanilytica]
MSVSNPKLYYAIWIIGFVLLLSTAYGILYALDFITTLPNASNLLNGDATFYHSIQQQGYVYVPGVPCNAGFFPFFAYIWRLTGLGVVGIAALNATVFLVAIWLNCLLLRPHPVVLGIFLSLPFLFYAYTPLSEAFFCLFSTGILWGYARGNRPLTFVALLLAGITRPTFLFFIPAMVGATLMQRDVRHTFTWANWRPILGWYVPPIALAFMTVALIQYVQLGEPFLYFSVQATVWGREFGFPVFPLADNPLGWLTRFRIFNYCLGLLAAGFGVKYLFTWLRGRLLPADLQPVELLSIIYLSMCLVSILFFNPEWHWIPDYQYTSTILTGINRYLQVNPFLLVFLVYLFRQRPASPWVLPLLLIGLHLVYFTVWPEYYTHIQKYLRLSVITGMFLLYALYHYRQWAVVGYALVIVSFFFQAWMFGTMLSGVLVD